MEGRIGGGLRPMMWAARLGSASWTLVGFHCHMFVPLLNVDDGFWGSSEECGSGGCWRVPRAQLPPQFLPTRRGQHAPLTMAARPT